MKSFQDCFNDIKGKLKEGQKVQMTPQQFENMLRQFYEAGKVNGIIEGKRTAKKSTSQFEDMFGSAFR
jgi:hypothetical protein|tara:strand:+ start:399 stop:602 length:204 start_codon:yes stop_codon:yes gene_type:complete